MSDARIIKAISNPSENKIFQEQELKNNLHTLLARYAKHFNKDDPLLINLQTKANAMCDKLNYLYGPNLLRTEHKSINYESIGNVYTRINTLIFELNKDELDFKAIQNAKILLTDESNQVFRKVDDEKAKHVLQLFLNALMIVITVLLIKIGLVFAAITGGAGVVGILSAIPAISSLLMTSQVPYHIEAIKDTGRKNAHEFLKALDDVANNITSGMNKSREPFPKPR